jgi:hypothetical protein
MQTSPSSPSLGSVKRTLLIVWLAMLFSIVVYVVIGESSAHGSQRPQAVFFEAITTVSIVAVIARVILRRKLLGDATRLLAQDPNSAQGLRQWQAGHIVSFALSEAVALFGFVLRFMGFTLREVVPFYIAGFVLMILSAPTGSPEQDSTS